MKEDSPLPSGTDSGVIVTLTYIIDSVLRALTESRPCEATAVPNLTSGRPKGQLAVTKPRDPTLPRWPSPNGQS